MGTWSMESDDKRSELIVDMIQCGDGIVRLRIQDNHDEELIVFWSVNSVKALHFAAFLVDWAISQDDSLREQKN